MVKLKLQIERHKIQRPVYLSDDRFKRMQEEEKRRNESDKKWTNHLADVREAIENQYNVDKSWENEDDSRDMTEAGEGERRDNRQPDRSRFDGNRGSGDDSGDDEYEEDDGEGDRDLDYGNGDDYGMDDMDYGAGDGDFEGSGDLRVKGSGDPTGKLD